MEHVTKKSIEEVSKRTGLSIEAVTELLNRGWTYVETLREPAKWVHPSAKLEVSQHA